MGPIQNRCFELGRSNQIVIEIGTPQQLPLGSSPVPKGSITRFTKGHDHAMPKTVKEITSAQMFRTIPAVVECWRAYSALETQFAIQIHTVYRLSDDATALLKQECAYARNSCLADMAEYKQLLNDAAPFLLNDTFTQEEKNSLRANIDRTIKIIDECVLKNPA